MLPAERGARGCCMRASGQSAGTQHARTAEPSVGCWRGFKISGSNRSPVGFAVLLLSMYACYMIRACCKCCKVQVEVSHDGYGSTSTKTSIYDTHHPESARSSGSRKGSGLAGLVMDSVCFTAAGCRKPPAAADAKPANDDASVPLCCAMMC